MSILPTLVACAAPRSPFHIFLSCCPYSLLHAIQIAFTIFWNPIISIQHKFSCKLCSIGECTSVFLFSRHWYYIRLISQGDVTILPNDSMWPKLISSRGQEVSEIWSLISREWFPISYFAISTKTTLGIHRPIQSNMSFASLKNINSPWVL